MRRLRKVTGQEAIRALQRLGFKKVRQRGSRGSHVILKKETSEGAVGCVIPLHRELKIGTLRGILRQAKVTPDEFMDVL
jgi:predicted RNA binding protein YcfA (HicA-like mRNA interferase family)